MKKMMIILCTMATLMALAGCDMPWQRERALSPEEIEMAAQFDDITASDWFYRYVVAGVRFGIIEGTSDDNLYFEPERNVTQGEFIAMLGRLHEYGHGVIGVPEEGGDDYERYIEWALDAGIVHRYNYWILMPDELITREQAAVIVWRYIDEFELQDYFAHDIDVYEPMDFGDCCRMSYWAQGPIFWLRDLLVVSGRGGAFDPHDTVTQADAMQILIRVCSAVYDLRHPLFPIRRSN